MACRRRSADPFRSDRAHGTSPHPLGSRLYWRLIVLFKEYESPGLMRSAKSRPAPVYLERCALHADIAKSSNHPSEKVQPRSGPGCILGPRDLGRHGHLHGLKNNHSTLLEPIALAVMAITKRPSAQKSLATGKAGADQSHPARAGYSAAAARSPLVPNAGAMSAAKRCICSRT
jgi:hypothetical protein